MVTGRRLRKARLVAVAALVAAVLAGKAPRARADGAFPGSLQILLPATHPETIYLATNFGLIISEDGGASWTWTCEQRATSMGYLYVLGPLQPDRIFVVPASGLAYSDDGSCSWQLAGGTLDHAVVSDVFPDPGTPGRVLAIGEPPGDGGATVSLFPSADGGATFGDAIFTGPPGAGLVGVEIARSDPRTIYVTMYTTDTSSSDLHPKLVRSVDGGASWTTFDLEPMLGTGSFRIMAVDPVDARIVYLRLLQPAKGSESVAITRDGGVTFATVITVSGGAVSAFARLASGTVLVGGIAADKGAVGFRSGDGGVSFQDWPGVPHLYALAERAGKLYAAAHNYTEGWAIGLSTDEGLTFQPLAAYDQVTAIKACAQTACLASCQYQASTNGTWPLAVCGLAPATPPSGGGCRMSAAPETANGAAAATANAATKAVTTTGERKSALAIAAMLLALMAVASRRVRR